MSVMGPHVAVSDCKLLRMLQKKGRPVNRGKNRLSVSRHKYVRVGLSAKRNGQGIISNRGTNSSAVEEILDNFIARTENIVREYVPTEEMRALFCARKLVPFGCLLPGSLPLFGSLAVATDYHSACHVDDDFWLSNLTVRVSGSCDSDAAINIEPNPLPAQAFLFPTIGVTVLLRPGDNLIFNPTIPHCCCPKFSQYESLSVHLCSFYLSSRVVGGNDNSTPPTEAQLDAARFARNLPN